MECLDRGSLTAASNPVGHPGLQQRLGKNCRCFCQKHEEHRKNRKKPWERAYICTERRGVNSFQLGQTWLVRVNLSSGLHYGWAIEGGVPCKAAEMWVFQRIYILPTEVFQCQKGTNEAICRGCWQRVQDRCILPIAKCQKPMDYV